MKLKKGTGEGGEEFALMKNGAWSKGAEEEEDMKMS